MAAGDLIFIDFEEKERGSEKTRPQSDFKERNESKAEKMRRLAAQIESGEYEVPVDELAETLIDELSGGPGEN